MPRPDKEGVRLRFSGPVAGETLALIIALPGLRPGESGNEVSSNVTISVDGSGRFFSTPNLEACWSEIQGQAPQQDGTYEVSATLYCVAPLGELNGTGAVTIPALEFTGVADWGSS